MEPWPAEIEVVDCHHHLWDLQANYYPWLTDRVSQRVCGEYAPIRRNYLLADFLRDASEVNLVQSVHLEAVIDRSDPVRETAWLQRMADEPQGRGFPHGIVAYCDFTRPDAADVLAAHAAFANLRGVRQMLHETVLDSVHPLPSLLENDLWWENFSLLERFDLSFELQVFPPQMNEAAKLVRAFPATQFVLCHTGQPVERTSAGLDQWRDGMQLLASFPNVAAKISGLGMFDRAWTVESLRPIVQECIAFFGSGRCLFASNFPVDGMMSTYGRLWCAYLEIVADRPPAEKRALFANNARRIYRLANPRPASLPDHEHVSHCHHSR